MKTFPGWSTHALLGRIAFETLSDHDKALFKPDMSTEGLAKPYFRMPIRSVGDKVGYLCLILDLIGYDDCRPYATLPDGRWIPHTPPDADGRSSVGSRQPMSPLMSVTLTELLMHRMLGAIRDGDGEAAVRHGGALAHYIQEPFTPGHAMDNTIFHEIFPDPDPGRHVSLHPAFDAASDTFEPQSPVLLGTTVAEAAFRAQIEIDRGMRDGKKLIEPVIRSVYAGEPASVRQTLLAGQCRQAVFLTASIWHTVLAIAHDTFDDNEKRKLGALPLTELAPYFVHACQYMEVLPGHLVREGRKIPIDVWQTDASGERHEVRVEQGFGMGGHSAIKFFVNGEVYSRFRCEVGLPSRHTVGQDAHTDVRFFVEMDTGENTVYSEEIEYGATTLAEVRLQPGAPLHAFDVNLSGARSLILRSRCEPYTEPETGEVRYSIPHVAVCNPVLTKG